MARIVCEEVINSFFCFQILRFFFLVISKSSLSIRNDASLVAAADLVDRFFELDLDDFSLSSLNLLVEVISSPYLPSSLHCFRR